MTLEILGPFALCLHCGTSRRALAAAAPTCCDDPALLSVWVNTPDQGTDPDHHFDPPVVNDGGRPEPGLRDTGSRIDDAPASLGGKPAAPAAPSHSPGGVAGTYFVPQPAGAVA